MPSCSARSCTNRSGNGISLHRFPMRDPKRLKQWLVNIKRTNWMPTPCSYLCSNHFEEKDFDQASKRKLLLKTAVPNIFTLPFHLKPKTTVRNTLNSQKTHTTTSTISCLNVKETMEAHAGPSKEATDVEMKPVDSRDSSNSSKLLNLATPTKTSSDEDNAGHILEPLEGKLKDCSAGSTKGSQGILLITAPLVQPSAPSSWQEVGKAGVKHVISGKNGIGAEQGSGQVPMGIEKDCCMDTLPSSALNNTNADSVVDGQMETEVGTSKGSQTQHMLTDNEKADKSSMDTDGMKPQETQMGGNKQLVAEPHQEVVERGSGRMSVSPPIKIKDEPVDEEYDRALAPQSTSAQIKDEPDSTEEFGQQQKTSEELKISAVFSVGGNSTAPASVAQPAKAAVTLPKTVTLNTPLPPLTPSMGSARVSCSGCKKVLLKGQTAYQRKGSSQLFCSTICLTGYTLPSIKSVLKKTCHYCLKEIENPKDVIIAPVDMAGTVKDFCSQSCLSSFDFKRKTAVSTLSSEGVTIKCSMCKSMAVIRHEVNYQGTVHKLCSDACFTRFRSSNNLTMNCCENCGGYCYSGNGQCHMLQIEGASKKLCSPSCVTAYKMKSVKVTPCTMCRSLRSSAEMVEHSTSPGKTELFCDSSCVTAYKVQAVSSSAAVLPCNHCKVTAVPQYHLAMSDGSMRNFCSYGCVINFQTAFNKNTTQNQLSVVPTSVMATSSPAPQPVVTTTASSDSSNPTAPPQVPAPVAIQPRVRLTCKHCYRLFASKPELLEFKGQMVQFCGKTCSEEFKKVNFVMARCEYCKIDKVVKEVKKINKLDCSFCSEGCKLLYKHDLAKRWGNHCRTCGYCSNTAQRVVQNHFSGKLEEFCSDECMSHYTVLFYQMSKCDACKRQGKLIESLKWLGEMKHFCNLQCLLQFCSQQNTYDPLGKAAPVATAPQGSTPQAPVTVAPAPTPTANQGVPAPSHLASKEATPVIANVVSLASAPTGQPSACANTALQGAVPATQAKVIEHASTQTDALKLPPGPPLRVLKNKALLCKPMSQNKGTICKPHTQSTETQTEDKLPRVLVLPVPVPVFIPVPVHLYTQYTPSPVGLPVPVPVPMFLPTTLDSAERIVQTMQEIKEKIPSDPYEADLILMADLLAEDEEKDKPISQGDQGSTYSGDLESEAVSTPHSWVDETTPSSHRSGRAPDRDVASKSSPPSPPPQLDLEADFPIESFDRPEAAIEDNEATSPSRHRLRRRARDGFPPRKRGRKRGGATVAATQSNDAQATTGGPRMRHMYGVNAWKTWVQWRSTQPGKETPRFGSRPMVLKEDVLQCTTAELSYGLCRFVTEVRRPNGESYSPDSLFYLCLGIQQHLFDNGRMENIFTDQFYGKFTSEITRILKEWKPTILPCGYLCSRIEEEYLWECKQLGAYSPIVLLNTLLFFSTKLFHFKTVPQHHRLSFAHVMRCTRTLKNNKKISFLRFYPQCQRKTQTRL
ncbi:hypothetical protein AGOR_G00037940 [Albula goreensis]|uniref:THAP-type domain-containing protein n=1 Tax=Albula goreensis TaxID=1534307 RepID=A0A8T3DXX2_9TELE|nr:hypothetical protein AGOR_G00037940 [Albula goreensis]